MKAFFSATFYAACASNNLVDKIYGENIDSIRYNIEAPQDQFKEIASAYDCCVACLVNNPTCGVSYSSFSDGLLYCTFLEYKDTCQADRVLFNVSSFFQPPETGFTISNSNCGSVGVEDLTEFLSS